jgi:hypothetical protein
MKNVQVSRAGAVIGQFEPTEVRQGLIEGKFLASDHYWIPGMKDWMPLSQFAKGAAARITPPASKPKAGRKLTGWLFWKVSLVPDKLGYAEWINRFVVAFLCVFYLLLFWLLLKYDAKSTKVSVMIEMPARAVKEEPRALASVVIAQPTQISESKPPVALERPASPVAVSRASSFEEIKAAAERGDMMAQFTMGDYYSIPVGRIVQDDFEASRWYLKAARRGVLEAQKKVMTRYYFGKGLENNLIEAYAWSLVAGERDDDARKSAWNLSVHRMAPDDMETGKRRAERLMDEIEAEKNLSQNRLGK